MCDLADPILDKENLLPLGHGHDGARAGSRFMGTGWPCHVPRWDESDRRGLVVRARHGVPVLCVLAGLLLLGAAPLARAQVTFNGVASVLSTGSITLSEPYGTVVDPSGNIYIADFLNNRIVKVNPQGAASVLSISGVSSLSHPDALALDSTGNLYIVDEENERIVEVSPSGSGSVVNLGSVSLSVPQGIAVNPSGNIFIADTGNNRIVEVSGGTASALAITVSPTPATLSSPAGLAVDTSGNLYIADSGNDRIVKVAAGGTTGSVLSITGLSNGLSGPTGVAVDGLGNVYIADFEHSRIAVVTPAGVGSVLSTGALTLNHPEAVSLDIHGTLYIADTTNNRVVEVQPTAVNFADVNIGSSSTLTLNYSVNTTTTFATNPTVVTQGAPNLDFTLSSNTCMGTITAPASCTVTAQFAPRAPGLRLGAVQLTNSTSTLLVTTMVYGIGQGPAVAFDPGAQTTLTVSVGAEGLSFPWGVGVDAAGDVFIADTHNSRVLEVPAGGGAQTTVGSGLSNPPGVAVDGAGDVFIADYTSKVVVEVPAGGGAQTTLGSGLSLPTGVAVDGAGNVFIADYAGNQVVEVPAGGGPQTTLPASGLNGPYGVAVDGAGDVFIADFGHNRVVELPAGGAAQITLGSGLDEPTGVAVDGAGDVFIADYSNSRVVEVPAGGGAQTTVGSGLLDPFGVAVDGVGDVFIADTGNSRVVEVQRSAAPTFSFATTVVGSTSSDSPQSVTAQNIGNQSLNAVAPGLSFGVTSFEQAAGPGTPPDCTTTFSLAPGASCNLSVMFVPQTNSSFVSDATFTDNALNGNPATQNIGLSGTGTPTTLTITASSQTMTYGGAAPTITPMYSGFVNGDTSAVVTGITCTTTASSSSPAGSSPFTSCSGAGAPSYYNIVYVNGSVTVNKASLTITASSTSMTYGGTPPAVTPMYSAFAGSDTAASLTTAPTCSTTATSATPAGTDTGANTCSGAVDNNYNFTYVAGNVTVGRASLTITASSTSMTYGGTPPAVTPMYSAFAGTDTVASLTPAPTCSTTASNTTPAGTDTGANTCSGAVDNNYNFTYVAGNVTVSKASLTITASSTSMTYGGTPPAVTPMYSAFAGTDTAASLTPAPTCSTTATSSTPAGTDTGANTCSGAVDSNYNFTYLAGNVTVNKATPAILLALSTSSQNPSPVYSAVTFVATVSPTASTPTGSLTFFDGTTQLSLGPLTPGQVGPGVVPPGVAAYTSTSFTVGTHSITAVYGGDANYLGVTSAPLVEQINPVTPTINWSPAAGITYGATLSGMLNATALNGTTQVAGSFAYTVTPSGGSASTVTNSTVLVAGSYTLTATFTPTDTTDYKSVSASVAFTVTKAQPTVSLVSSLNPVLKTNSVTFTATVSSPASIPTGSVSFYDGTTLISSGTLTAGGVATYTTSSLAIGTHSLTVTYSGDANFASVTSSVVAQLVEDFALNVSPAPAGTASPVLYPGSTATYVFFVGPSNGLNFPSAVTFTLTGLPPGATGTLTPTSLAAGSAGTNITLVIQLANQILARNHANPLGRGLALAMVGGIFLLPFGSRMRRSKGKAGRAGRWAGMLMLMLAITCATLGLSACGGTSGGYFAQQPVNYTVTITATSGSLSHTTTVTLTVQ